MTCSRNTKSQLPNILLIHSNTQRKIGSNFRGSNHPPIIAREIPRYPYPGKSTIVNPIRNRIRIQSPRPSRFYLTPSQMLCSAFRNNGFNNEDFYSLVIVRGWFGDCTPTLERPRTATSGLSAAGSRKNFPTVKGRIGARKKNSIERPIFREVWGMIEEERRKDVRKGGEEGLIGKSWQFAEPFDGDRNRKSPFLWLTI